MRNIDESEKYFLISQFEEGWGMEDIIDSEEQLLMYCTEALYIPEEKIGELNLDENDSLELTLRDLDSDDFSDDWYVNLTKVSKEIS